MAEFTTYDGWEASISDALKEDALWSVTAYRLALFAGDIGWYDVRKLVGVPALRSVGDQLYRALGSISANIAEGYSRSTGRDRARFYEYALGSARESRDWYYKGRHALRDQVYVHRTHLLTRVAQLLIKMISQQRPTKTGALRELVVDYEPEGPTRWAAEPIPFEGLNRAL